MKLANFLTRAAAVLCCSLSINAIAGNVPLVVEREDVQVFINDVASKHGYDKKALEQLFRQVNVREAVVNSIKNPAEAKPWHFYKSFFVDNKKRQREGIAFWQANQEILNQAEKKFGVPANIIVAILGIETFYGQSQGKYRVIDSLSTLAFEYPKRAPFFRKELEHYLLMADENKLDPLAIYGSYAGAMGYAQFMPSSYRNFAVSYSGSNEADLMNSPQDAIFSIANYLSVNGWKTGAPIAHKTTVKGKKYEQVLPKPRHYQPTYTQTQLANYNIRPIKQIPNTEKAVILALDGKHNKEYWLGFQNFYAITRYNPSENYAMAVFLLGDKLNKLKNQTA